MNSSLHLKYDFKKHKNINIFPLARLLTYTGEGGHVGGAPGSLPIPVLVQRLLDGVHDLVQQDGRPLLHGLQLSC